jgi:outer membrane lipoprotein-sorting protein
MPAEANMRAIIASLLLLLGSAALAQDDKPEPAKPAEDQEEANPETLDELLERVEKAHKEHKDFKGKFEQTRYLPLFSDTVKSSGTFAFKRPDKVRWEYSTPHKSILVVSGDSGRKWSETTRKVESFKLSDDRGLDAVVKQLFRWFKGEFTKLKDDYTVEIKARDPVKLSMVPRSEALRKFIASIEVEFTKGEEQIASVKILEPKKAGDAEGGYTLYAFSETKLDSGLEADEFEIRK